jgi:hypothetical protein
MPASTVGGEPEPEIVDLILGSPLMKNDTASLNLYFGPLLRALKRRARSSS